MKEVELFGLREHAAMGGIPVLLLKEMDEDERILPIFIGKPEALSIALALEGVHTSRPMTHDLVKDILAETTLELLRVDIIDLEDRTFFAELEFVSKDKEVRVSARPSDAIALAVRCNAPIFAAEKVLEEAGFVPEFDEDGEGDDADEHDDMPDQPPEEVIEEFKTFLSNVSADDFESS